MPTSPEARRAYFREVSARHRAKKLSEIPEIDVREKEAKDENRELKRKVAQMEPVVDAMRKAARESVVNLVLTQLQARADMADASTQTDPSPPPKAARKAGAPWNPAFD